MFEFGRDLRKLFDKARESEDLGWVELIGVDLLHAEARRESIDAGRVSCSRPFETERRAGALWREHARRTGAGDSLDRAERAADSLSRTAGSDDQRVLAAIDRAQVLLLRFDLCGDPVRLSAALEILTEERNRSDALAGYGCDSSSGALINDSTARRGRVLFARSSCSSS